MTKIRTLIVDDEPMARERVLSLLQQQPDIEVVGECADGAQALSAIERLEPELVFLDVQIPVMDGFGVIRALAPNRMPTGRVHDGLRRYALKAFEVHALDYLLKPFDSPRFLRTLERARDRLERQRAGDLGQRLLAMVQDLKPEPTHPPDRLVVKSGGRIFFVRTDEIDWVDAAGNYVRLHVKGDVVPVPRDDVGDGSAAGSVALRPHSSLAYRERRSNQGTAARQRRLRRRPAIGHSTAAQPRIPGQAAGDESLNGHSRVSSQPGSPGLPSFPSPWQQLESGTT